MASLDSETGEIARAGAEIVISDILQGIRVSTVSIRLSSETDEMAKAGAEIKISDILQGIGVPTALTRLID